MKNIEEKREHEKLLTTIQPGIEIFFEKYFNDVDPKTVKTYIEVNKAMGVTHVDGTINNNKNLDFSFTIQPSDNANNELGFYVGGIELSGELIDLIKEDYSRDREDSKDMLSPTQLLLQKMEDEKAKSKESKK